MRGRRPVSRNSGHWSAASGRSDGGRISAFRRSLPPLQAAAPWMAAAASLVTLAAALRWSTYVVGGSDSYCYVSQAGFWLDGALLAPQPVGFTPPWPNAALSLTPTGYIPSTSIPGAIAPLCPAGLSLAMAALSAIAGPPSVFLVVPVLGALSVWLCVLPRSRAGSPRHRPSCRHPRRRQPHRAPPGRAADERRPRDGVVARRHGPRSSSWPGCLGRGPRGVGSRPDAAKPGAARSRHRPLPARPPPPDWHLSRSGAAGLRSWRAARRPASRLDPAHAVRLPVQFRLRFARSAVRLVPRRAEPPPLSRVAAGHAHSGRLSRPCRALRAAPAARHVACLPVPCVLDGCLRELRRLHPVRRLVVSAFPASRDAAADRIDGRRPDDARRAAAGPDRVLRLACSAGLCS